MVKKTSDKPVSAFELLGKSFQLVKENLNVFILLYSVSALFALWNFLNWFTDDRTTWTEDRLSLNNWFGSFSGLQVDTPAGMGAGLALVVGIIALIFSLLQIILVFRVAQGRKPDIGDIWEEFKKVWFKLLLLVIVMGLIVVVGFILLIIPGVIFLWRFFFAPYVMLDHGTGVEESLRRSWRMTKGFGWPIYSVILLGLLMGLSGIIFYIGPIISFILAVAYSCAPTLRYWEVKRLS